MYYESTHFMCQFSLQLACATLEAAFVVGYQGIYELWRETTLLFYSLTTPCLFMNDTVCEHACVTVSEVVRTYNGAS
jgi:hypothetical protein